MKSVYHLAYCLLPLIYSKLQSIVPQIEMSKTIIKIHFAIYFCGGFDLNLL